MELFLSKELGPLGKYLSKILNENCRLILAKASLFKVSYRCIRERCKTSSKLTVEVVERRQWVR